MKLYDLVNFRHKIVQALRVDETVLKLQELKNNIAAVKLSVNVINDHCGQYLDDLLAHYDELIGLVQKPHNDLEIQLEYVNGEIDKMVHQLFANNYNIEGVGMTAEQGRYNKIIQVSDDVANILKSRITLHTAWHYPALEISCRDGEWTKYMIAADPLYIIDRYPEFLESASSQFPEQFQTRLRRYPLVDNNLGLLPRNQFGFVFSWGYFNYVSLDTLKIYLTQIIRILRPGGVFLFSYNDGDTPAGAEMAERFAQSYLPKSMVVPLAESLGFEIQKTFELGEEWNPITWIELKRPGELATNKAAQVMGEIKRINF